MSSLVTKIKLYAEANSKVANFDPFTGNVEISDIGDGPKIAKWQIDGLSKPTTSQLNSFEAEATKSEKNQNIDAKRKLEYLPFQDQLEMIYKDQKNGTTTFKDHCDKVRSDNPKET